MNLSPQTILFLVRKDLSEKINVVSNEVQSFLNAIDGYKNFVSTGYYEDSLTNTPWKGFLDRLQGVVEGLRHRVEKLRDNLEFPELITNLDLETQSRFLVNFLIKIDEVRNFLSEYLAEFSHCQRGFLQFLEAIPDYYPVPKVIRRNEDLRIYDFVLKDLSHKTDILNDLFHIKISYPILTWDYFRASKFFVSEGGDRSKLTLIRGAYWIYNMPYYLPSFLHEVVHSYVSEKMERILLKKFEEKYNFQFSEAVSLLTKSMRPLGIDVDYTPEHWQVWNEQLLEELIVDSICMHILRTSYLLTVFFLILGKDLRFYASEVPFWLHPFPWNIRIGFLVEFLQRWQPTNEILHAIKRIYQLYETSLPGFYKFSPWAQIADQLSFAYQAFRKILMKIVSPSLDSLFRDSGAIKPQFPLLKDRDRDKELFTVIYNAVNKEFDFERYGANKEEFLKNLAEARFASDVLWNTYIYFSQFIIEAINKGEEGYLADVEVVPIGRVARLLFDYLYDEKSKVNIASSIYSLKELKEFLFLKSREIPAGFQNVDVFFSFGSYTFIEIRPGWSIRSKKYEEFGGEKNVFEQRFAGSIYKKGNASSKKGFFALYQIHMSSFRRNTENLDRLVNTIETYMEQIEVRFYQIFITMSWSDVMLLVNDEGVDKLFMIKEWLNTKAATEENTLGKMISKTITTIMIPVCDGDMGNPIVADSCNYRYLIKYVLRLRSQEEVIEDFHREIEGLVKGITKGKAGEVNVYLSPGIYDCEIHITKIKGIPGEDIYKIWKDLMNKEKMVKDCQVHLLAARQQNI